MCRHERRLLPLPVELLRPAPDRPLPPLNQRRQRPWKFSKVELICGRFVVAACHGAAAPLKVGGGPDFFESRAAASFQISISSLRSSSSSSTGSAGTGGGTGGGFAAVWPLAPCFGGGMRSLITGTIRPRNSSWVGKAMMILPIQPLTGSPNAPRRVRLLTRLRTRPRGSFVNHTTSFFSLSFPTPISSSVTALIFSFFSAVKSCALKYFD